MFIVITSAKLHMLLKRLYPLLVIQALLLYAMGCSPVLPAAPGRDTGVGQGEASQMTTAIPASGSGSSQDNSAVFGSLSATPSLRPEPSSTAESMETPATLFPTNVPFHICSPLSIHSLEELPEIISDPYRPPPPGKEQRHHGIDFSYYRRGDRLSIQGIGVQSVLDGVVAAVLMATYPYGNVVIIETRYASLPQEWVDALQVSRGESIYTLYAHMDNPTPLSLREIITTCQRLGEVGVSGNTVEPHLHLEMRLGPPGATFTSMAYYGAKDTDEERSNYLRWRTGGEFQHFDPMLVLEGLNEKQSNED